MTLTEALRKCVGKTINAEFKGDTVIRIEFTDGCVLTITAKRHFISDETGWDEEMNVEFYDPNEPPPPPVVWTQEEW